MKKNSTVLKVLFIIIISITAIGLILYKLGVISYITNEESEVNAENINDKDTSEWKDKESFLMSMDEKELIHYKIINAIDFFSSVEGEISEINQFGENINTKYIIDIKKNSSLITKQNKDMDMDTIYNNKNCIELDNINKKYNVIKCDELSSANINPYSNININGNESSNIDISELYKLKPENRYDIIGVLLPRSTQLTNGVSKSVLAESPLGAYLKDYDKWSIKGKEVFLDRDCTIIEGKSTCVDTKTKAEKYRAVIDSDTGIVLKYEDLNNNDEVVFSFETTYIKFNSEYDTKIFELNTLDYTEAEYEGK